MSAQKKKTLIIVCAAVVLVAAMLAVWFAFGPKGTAGQKAIGVTVVYADATTDEFSFSRHWRSRSLSKAKNPNTVCM